MAAGCAGTGNCYWVGGSGNTNDIAHWATTSGGATTGGLPTSLDNCTFDSLSNATSYTATINTTTSCKDFNASNPVSGIFTLAGTGSNELRIYGTSVIFGSGVLVTASYRIRFVGIAPYDTIALTTNAVYLPFAQWQFSLGGDQTVQLHDNLNLNGDTTYFNFITGNLDSNGHDINITYPSGGNSGFTTSKDLSVNNLSIVYPSDALSPSVTLGGNLTINGTLSITGGATNNRIYLRSSVIGTNRVIRADSPVFANVDFKDVYAAPYVFTDRIVVAMGDSMTNVNYETPLQTAIRNYSGYEFSVLHKGVSGEQTSQMLARFATDVIDIPNAEYVTILGGINDLVNYRSATAIEADLQSMYTAAHNDGLKVIAKTILPFKGTISWSVDLQNELDAINYWILHTATDVDYRVDTYSAMEDPTNPDYLNPAYALAGNLHPSTPTGYAALAAYEFSQVPWPQASILWDLSSITGKSGDAGGNKRITFTSPQDQYWKHGATVSTTWTASNWYTTSGGSTSSRMPLPQDTAIFDANSFPSSGKTVTVNWPRLPTTTFAAVTNFPTITPSTALSVFGSLTLAPAANWTFTASTQDYTFEGRSLHTLTTNGNTWAKTLTLNAPGGTLELADTPTMGAGNTFTVTNGTLASSYKVMTISPATAFTQVGGVINFYNNVFYRASAAGTLINQTAGTLNLKNNIFYNISDVLSSAGGTNTIFNNDYYNSSNEGGTGSTTTDPLFVSSGSDFNLVAMSTVIDAGVNLNLIADIAGNPIYCTPDIGAYEYQPPFTVGTDLIDPSGNIRIYADGKYRYLTATSSSASVDLSVSHAEGDWTYDASTTRPMWLDKSKITWGDTKSWTASSSVATTTIFTIGDLIPNTIYIVTVDGATSTDIASTSCSNGNCTSGPDGRLALTYSGGYSSHEFELSMDTTSPTVGLTDPIPSQTVSGTIDLSATSTDDVAVAGVTFYRDTTAIGSEITSTSSPDTYSTTWDTTSVADGSYTITAVSRDTSGNYATSSGVVITANNVAPASPAAPSSPSSVSSGSSASSRVRNLISMGNYQLAGEIARQYGITIPGQNTATPIAPAVNSNEISTFSKTLRFGMTNSDVKKLQVFLNKQGFTVSLKGAGSSGNETNYFGPATKAALMKFQETYRKDTLDPQGLKAPTGFFGRDTMKTVNSMLFNR